MPVIECTHKFKNANAVVAMPKLTLFSLVSVDGKISTGSIDERDYDKDLPNVDYICDGLQQYYDIEKTMSSWSLLSGKTCAKIGYNSLPTPEKIDVNFAVVDNHHLYQQGIQYLCSRAKKVVLITENKSHPALSVKVENIHIILQEEMNIEAALHQLYSNYGCSDLTVQTGSTINALLLRKGLIDCIDIVVAPMLVGGIDTAGLIGGASLNIAEELKSSLKRLELKDIKRLDNSYIRLQYALLN